MLYIISNYGTLITLLIIYRIYLVLKYKYDRYLKIKHILNIC